MIAPPTSVSPDGRYEIHVTAWEARMSHWIETPSLTDTRNKELLLHFKDGNWSMEKAQWTGDTVVRMEMRKYPGDHRPSVFEVVIDCAQRSAAVGGTPVAQLGEVEAALERLYLANRR